MSSLVDYVAEQDALLQEAALALPHTFESCTYSHGHIRQAVYLCKTCAVPRGVCTACSVACHTDHEQLELFPKRAFRCDCPTHALSHACTLHKTPEEVNEGNVYGQNFRGLFCRCGREYNAEEEKETMIQCLACEDWFHESCLNLRERPSSRPPTPKPQPEPPTNGNAPTTTTNGNNEVEDSEDGDLPPGLITADDYDALICSSCVRSRPILRRYAGTPNTLMIIRDSAEAPWRVHGRPEPATSTEVLVDVGSTESLAGRKRALSSSENGNGEASTKRARTEDTNAAPVTAPKGTHSSASPCLAPSPSATAQHLLAQLDAFPPNTSLGAGDIFLAGEWRARWCQCSNCKPELDKEKWLLLEEETYEPPEDPDSGLSLDQLGMQALNRLPREKVIDGIRAFNDMRDELMSYLRPFAEQGKAVGEEDINRFFEARKSGAAR
ncbi:unnamed protein product [Peniophora sp. CBMAI 1063]|nr:unnamed protein product [Peniophora sp. CBMAI 1063]